MVEQAPYTRAWRFERNGPFQTHAKRRGFRRLYGAPFGAGPSPKYNFGTVGFRTGTESYDRSARAVGGLERRLAGAHGTPTLGPFRADAGCSAGTKTPRRTQRQAKPAHASGPLVVLGWTFAQGATGLPTMAIQTASARAIITEAARKGEAEGRIPPPSHAAYVAPSTADWQRPRGDGILLAKRAPAAQGPNRARQPREIAWIRGPDPPAKPSVRRCANATLRGLS